MSDPAVKDPRTAAESVPYPDRISRLRLGLTCVTCAVLLTSCTLGILYVAKSGDAISVTEIIWSIAGCSVLATLLVLGEFRD